MEWMDLLRGQIEYTYGVTEKLLNLVEDSELGWKPSTGSNWMTTGQVISHITNACGEGMKAFVTEDWTLPDGTDMKDLPEDAMLPAAEKMPSVSSIAEAKKLFAADKKLALEMLAKTTPDDLVNKIAKAPWDPMELPLGHRLLQMLEHLNSHKAQLFYYLKLQGKDVNTGHLWGM
jgi:hypothetical protein